MLLEGAADVAPLLLRLHLAMFYLLGSFRHASDRAVGLRFVSICERPYRNFSYKPFGVLLILQVFGQVISRYVHHRRQLVDAAAEKEREAEVVKEIMGGMSAEAAKLNGGLAFGNPDRQPTCNICMCPAETATSTPCGHLFCWDCIASWCASKPTCPLCRTSVLPQQLLPLNHYEVSPPGNAREPALLM